MKPVQLLLICGTAGALFVYLAYFRSKLSDRLIGLLLLSTAWFSILFPDYTTVVAHVLGVGRGVDLIFYLFGLFTTFALILLFTSVRTQSAQLTELIRHLAIRDAIVGPVVLDRGTAEQHRADSDEDGTLH
jgi:small membrane protein